MIPISLAFKPYVMNNLFLLSFFIIENEMSYQIALRIMILCSCIPDYCGNQGQVGNVIPENISVEKQFFYEESWIYWGLRKFA